MKISRRIILRMRNISSKLCRGHQNTHTFEVQSIFPEYGTVYDIVSKKPGGAREAADDNEAHARCMLN